MYLACRYLGNSTIEKAIWQKQVSASRKSKPVAGFINNNSISHSGFSVPDSITNLKVKMSVSSVEAEGQYNCEFESEVESYSGNVFLTVQGEKNYLMRFPHV